MPQRYRQVPNIAMNRLSATSVEVELAHDPIALRDVPPALRMVFRVDTVSQAAELLAIQDECRHEHVYSDADSPRCVASQ